ncbi:hypothetical protein JSO19_01755 [Leucobacter sp. UCMA 4100]|uniref:hypothetical protein n=1 Tax=Leucobacter sp. UCMA 4100 TaxID=2810534 RepID=UPI0022EB6CCE|nr:hypothetical protein [Leucobacter sp. UCMA 4100]MDA3146100.1 hypothetical protein [Leucobacter sp. UCMA 4100]
MMSSMWNPELQLSDQRATMLIVIHEGASTVATVHDSAGEVLSARVWGASVSLLEVAAAVRTVGLSVGHWQSRAGQGVQGGRESWASLSRWTARAAGAEGGWEKEPAIPAPNTAWRLPRAREEREDAQRIDAAIHARERALAARRPHRPQLAPLTPYPVIARKA